MGPELWRRTTIYIRRTLARIMGMTQKHLAAEIRVSYTKVAEYQRRGALHFHAVIRVDGSKAKEVAPPPARFTVERLEEAIRIAASEVASPHPLDPEGLPPVVWGEQLHLRRIQSGGATTPEAAAAYLAKYATKSSEELEPAGARPTREHIARLRRTAERLAELPQLEHLNLSGAAASIGFRGHWSTRSRRYSTTFTALRQARAKHAKAAAGQDEEPAVQVDAEWRYAGAGYTTAADVWLAASAGNSVRERRQSAKLELRAIPEQPR